MQLYVKVPYQYLDDSLTSVVNPNIKIRQSSWLKSDIWKDGLYIEMAPVKLKSR